MGWERRRERGRIAKRRSEKSVGFFRERSSTFSLEFSAIGPSVSGEERSKVAPHGKGYVWVPVLWSFEKLRKVGVFSYSVYFRFKSLVNDLGGVRL